MIQERLRDPPKTLSEMEKEDEEDHHDGWRRRKRIAFLDLLLQMHRQDESFTLRDVQEEVDTFMFAVRTTDCPKKIKIGLSASIT